MIVDLPQSWQLALKDELTAGYFADLQSFVRAERQAHEVFPPAADVFAAFRFTPLDQVRIVLLGQDPYHDDGQAHGLCFSVRPGVKPPPSLVNIFKELHADIGCTIPDHGFLEPWARFSGVAGNPCAIRPASEPFHDKTCQTGATSALRVP